MGMKFFCDNCQNEIGENKEYFKINKYNNHGWIKFYCVSCFKKYWQPTKSQKTKLLIPDFSKSK